MGAFGTGIPDVGMLICQSQRLNSGKRNLVVRMELQDKDIKCLIVWECTIKRMKKNQADCEKYLKMTEKFMKGNQTFLEI